MSRSTVAVKVGFMRSSALALRCIPVDDLSQNQNKAREGQNERSHATGSIVGYHETTESVDRTCKYHFAMFRR